jgi:predicted MFS family arabinose efflux permease
MRHWSIVRAASVAITGITLLAVDCLPAIGGVLSTKLRFTAGEVGAFGTAGYVGIALGSLIAIPLMKRLRPRGTAILGLSLFAVANLLSLVLVEPGSIIELGAVSGTGAGCAGGVCYYIFGLRDQERNAAAALLAQSAFALLAIPVIPLTVRVFGWQSIFAGLAGLSLPCLLLTRFFPSDYGSVDQEGREGTTASKIGLWLGLTSVALYTFGMLTTWAYLEQIGVASGLDERSIGRSLSICAAFGFLSSLTVLVLGARVSQTRYVVACVFLYVIGVTYSASSTPWVYAAAISAFYFSIPIFLSAQFAEITRRAGTASIGISYQLTASLGALGPALAGALLARWGYGVVRWGSIGTMLLATALLWIGFGTPSSRRFVRARD